MILHVLGFLPISETAISMVQDLHVETIECFTVDSDSPAKSAIVALVASHNPLLSHRDIIAPAISFSDGDNLLCRTNDGMMIPVSTALSLKNNHLSKINFRKYTR